MERGYIKLWRKIDDSVVFKNEGLLKLWIWCLISANHKKRWVSVKVGRAITEVEVDKGSFIFGRESAAKKLDMSPSTIWKRMQKLKKLQKVNIKSDRHYSIISITNWDTYQPPKNKRNSKGDSRVTAEEQPSNTNKNEENYKIKKNTSKTAYFFTYRNKRYSLEGKRFSTFQRFWNIWEDKSGKTGAAYSWLKIPELTDSLVDEICAGAERYNLKRKQILEKGLTPKMAQGWLASQRWEDRGVVNHPKTNTRIYCHTCNRDYPKLDFRGGKCPVCGASGK